MLRLPIKEPWFSMIRSGEKLEEYRAGTPYYAARFARHQGKPLRLLLRNGYRADSPTLEVLVVPQFRAGAKPEWGGDPAEVCWVLEIREVHEVAQSRWVPHGNIVYDRYKCARCGHVIQSDDMDLPRECPHCHAHIITRRAKR